ncbi:MAG: DMT family transporter [Rhodospirillaceae bacterium]|nr:DMT family transporter [Rhodospirillaceae bacterium]MYB15334.1 DMT family transporter [Rhodospirillaceae bacterium]MYI47942.1 DMT family transporter [Rhodospirillaceae bacterium]
MTDSAAIPPSGPPAPHSAAAAYGLLAAVVCIWGVNWPFMKMGLEWLPPFWFNFLRLALGALTLCLILGVAGRLRLPPRHDWPMIAIVGTVQIGLYMGLVHWGLQYVPAGRASILAYTTPIWVVPGAMLFLGERLTGLRALGLLAGLAGIAALFNPLSFDWSDGQFVKGNLILLAGALCWATGIVFVKRHVWRCTPLDAVPWQLTIAAAIAFVLAIAVDSGRPVVWNTPSILILLYNGSLATALAVWAVISINRALPAVTTSLAMLGVPAGGLFLSALILGEALTLSLLLGLFLIVAGIAIVAFDDRKRMPPTAA